MVGTHGKGTLTSALDCFFSKATGTCIQNLLLYSILPKFSPCHRVCFCWSHHFQVEVHQCLVTFVDCIHGAFDPIRYIGHMNHVRFESICCWLPAYTLCRLAKLCNIAHKNSHCRPVDSLFHVIAPFSKSTSPEKVARLVFGRHLLTLAPFFLISLSVVGRSSNVSVVL